MSDEVITELYASPARRILGVGMLLVLGGLLLYTGLAFPPAHPGWQVFLLGMGALCVWVAERMRQATAHGVQLTEDGLRSSDGEVIAAMDDIDSVDRSIFVFKPSNGFVVRLKRSPGARWMPGLWWRMGKRIGIGGVTPGGAGKIMADMLGAMLLQRDHEGDGPLF
ncbi:MAG: hypothetical protein AAGL23_14390 [Pseudomonadota bacterium]